MNSPARVLIVEDEWLIAEDHAIGLRSAGYEVVGPVSSCKAADRLLQSEAVDAALLDVQLNGEKSYALADELMRRNVPFVFVSGYSDNDIPPHLLSHTLLLKPATHEMIVTAIAEMGKLPHAG